MRMSPSIISRGNALDTEAMRCHTLTYWRNLRHTP